MRNLTYCVGFHPSGIWPNHKLALKINDRIIFSYSLFLCVMRIYAFFRCCCLNIVILLHTGFIAVLQWWKVFGFVIKRDLIMKQFHRFCLLSAALSGALHFNFVQILHSFGVCLCVCLLLALMAARCLHSTHNTKLQKCKSQPFW